MRSTLVIAEITDDGPELATVTRDLPGFVRGARYRCVENADVWVFLELEEPRFARAAARRLAGGQRAVRSLHEVHRMARDADGTPVQVPGSARLETLGDYLMSVVLPVPPGRRDEWIDWYDTQHMPSVLSLDPGIEVGHRFVPLDDGQPDAHLVLYEFPSADALAAFAGGGVPVAKKSAYTQRWQVANVRRTFRIVARVESSKSTH
ncbi:hypothetical protein [Cryptosporangium sp. NPDC048952]|uniref:hypothetical protein n=1 Tax=Cryptosporangium sp. NPDC048952 TaxID=3363961 RepID=UPI00372285BA